MENTPKETNKVVPLMLRLPSELHAKIKDLAEHDRRSLNTMVVLLLESKVADAEKDERTLAHAN